MRVSVPTYVEIRSVAEQMREADFQEFVNVSHAGTRWQLADALARRYDNHPDAFLFGDEHHPIAVGAMVFARPRVATIMFFATDEFPKIALPLAKWTRRWLLPEYEDRAHRVECISMEGHVDAHRWISMCGLRLEAGPLLGYGKGGQSYYQFSKVRHDLCTPAA